MFFDYNMYAGRILTLNDSYQNYRTIIFIVNAYMENGTGSRYSSYPFPRQFLNEIKNQNQNRVSLTNYWSADYFGALNIGFTSDTTLQIYELNKGIYVTGLELLIYGLR